MTDPGARARARELRRILDEANRRYYLEDDPSLTDAEYDRLLLELRDLEEAHPGLRDPGSPTQTIGAPPATAFAKARHRTPMMSLENVFDEAGFRAFVERTGRLLGVDAGLELTWTVEPKIDGISISLTYEDGRLVRAATRGDGETGEDVTANVRTIRGVPLVLPSDATRAAFEVRGEVYVAKRDFERFNRGRSEEEGRYMNPRNFAGGSLRQLDPAVTRARPLRVALYSIPEALALGIRTQSGVLALLGEWGFPTLSSWCRSATGSAAAEAAHAWLRDNRDALAFEADGSVVKVDDLALAERLGARSRTPRSAVAWKFPAREEATVLKRITVSVGRTGALTPVAELEPVLVGGVMVSSATLHNQDEIDRLDVREGDRVVVQRAGDVIPKVVKVIPDPGHARRRRFRLPDRCPVCGTAVVEAGDEVVTRCPNGACPAQVKARLRHAASSDALDIEGLGEKLIDQLVDRGLVREIPDFFALDEETLAGLDRMGEKSARNLVRAIDRSRDTTLPRLIKALGIRHVGDVVAEILAPEVQDLEGLLAMSEERLTAIPEVGPVVARSIRADLQKPGRAQELRRLAAICRHPDPVPRGARGPLAGLVAVVTGVLPGWSREEAESALKAAGAKIGSGVSRATSFVLAGEKPGSKLARARELGKPVLDEAAVRAWIETGRSPLPPEPRA
jgi:DNA ligase (NAD+)